jgi:hypothetical protein
VLFVIDQARGDYPLNKLLRSPTGIVRAGAKLRVLTRAELLWEARFPVGTIANRR